MADAMDSKSISRKGVGVQLPSLAPAVPALGAGEAAELLSMGREVGEVLWPGLGDALHSARLELDSLLDGLRLDRAGVLRDESRLRLQETLAARARRAGWCLGVLAAAQGFDLLRGRREAEGLRWMVGTLAEVGAFRPTPPASELPRIAGVRDPWEISLLATWCALQVGQSPAGRLRWRAGEHGTSKWLAFESGSAHVRLARYPRLSSAERRPPRLGLAMGLLVLTWR